MLLWKDGRMGHHVPLTAQLVADLFLAIEQDDPLAARLATQALARRIGVSAAVALAAALIADRSLPPEQTSHLPAWNPALVRCA